MNGLERLEQELAEVSDLLEAFDNPPTSEAPSLRLLEDALRERRDAIVEKLESGRRHRLEVVLQTIEGVPEAGLIGRVLTLIDEAVRDAVDRLAPDAAPPPGRRLSVRVGSLTSEEDVVTVELTDAALPDRLTLRDGDDRPLGAAAFEAAVAELADPETDRGARLRRCLGESGASASMTPDDDEPRVISVSST